VALNYIFTGASKSWTWIPASKVEKLEQMIAHHLNQKRCCDQWVTHRDLYIPTKKLGEMCGVRDIE